MKREPHGGAAPCPVPAAARLQVGDEAFDYSDAFVLGVPVHNRSSAEVWARAMFTPSGPIWTTFGVAWGLATGVRPPPQGKRLGFFKVATPRRGSAVLTADGPRYRIHLVVLVGDGRMTFATFVKAHSTAWRQVLRGIMVAHRRVAPRMMQRALGLMSER